MNVQSLKVGQPHQVWKSIPHDVRIVKRAYPKLCLLTGTYILQENRARFNQYSVRDCCLLCGAGAQTRTHFIAGRSRLEPIRVIFKEQLTTILSRKKTLNVISEVLLDKEKLVELILDCSYTVLRGLLQLDESIVLHIENLSRNLCYSLHQKRSEILGLSLRKLTIPDPKFAIEDKTQDKHSDSKNCHVYSALYKVMVEGLIIN